MKSSAIYLKGYADNKECTRGAQSEINLNVLVGASSRNSYNAGQFTVERENDGNIRSFIISFNGKVLSVIDYNEKTHEFQPREQ